MSCWRPANAFAITLPACREQRRVDAPTPRDASLSSTLPAHATSIGVDDSATACASVSMSLIGTTVPAPISRSGAPGTSARATGAKQLVSIPFQIVEMRAASQGTRGACDHSMERVGRHVRREAMRDALQPCVSEPTGRNEPRSDTTTGGPPATIDAITVNADGPAGATATS
jgi:hypothetical protein